MTNWNGILCLSALIGVLSVPFAACGGDDDTDGSGGKGGSKAGSSGSGSEVAGTGGSSGAAGGGNSINDLINMFTMAMCEADAATVDSCGSESCPAPASGGLMGCTVSCCTSDDHCGTRNADTRFTQILGSACSVPAMADPRCPSMSFGNMSIPGCCDGNNQCGQLLGTTCIAGGLTGGFGGTARTLACDAANGGDAGVDTDGGL
jgi:hypothetical protein